jgi:hypothetical protein
MLLGSLQKGSLDMMGAVVDLLVGGHPGLEWILRIQNPSMCAPFEVAVPSREHALEWMASIKETAQSANVRVSSVMDTKLCPQDRNLRWRGRHSKTLVTTYRTISTSYPVL